MVAATLNYRCIIVAVFEDGSANQGISAPSLGVDLLAGRQLCAQPAHMGANRTLVAVISFAANGIKDFAIGKPRAARRGEKPVDVGLGFRHLARRRSRRETRRPRKRLADPCEQDLRANRR